jgi:thioredoxin reductase
VGALSTEPPFAPGDYPVVVVGSGPGGLQTSYWLRRYGVEHAVISEDEEPGGMFRSFPIFDNLLSWTKPHAPDDDLRTYELHDQNSLTAEEPELRALVREFMEDGSDLPGREALTKALRTFAERAPVAVRYGCRWQSTRRENGRLVLVTSDGEFSCGAAILAIGMTEPWLPAAPGIEEVTHYVAMRRARDSYRGRRVCIIGKRNSGFEVGRALLGVVRELTLLSPRSVETSFARAPVRSQYLQPLDEDARGAAATRVYDAALDRIERRADGFLVHAIGTRRSEPLEIEADDVIAATGFRTPLLDLPDLGLTTVVDGRLPALTPFWESVSIPGLFFAGNVMQAARGLRKHGVASNSSMVVGFRYNARILARHMAETRFGRPPERSPLPSDQVVPFLLRELSLAPELRMQKGYLARVVTVDAGGIHDEGVLPLEHFVDEPGSDGVAVSLELDPAGTILPVVYVRRGGRVHEESLEPNLRRSYEGPDYVEPLASLLRPLLTR